MEIDIQQLRIEAAYLSSCSPQLAYDWLYTRRHNDDDSLYQNKTPDVLEYLLARRNDPLLDLGIARFGNSCTVIRKVFCRGSIGVRCAALSNPRIGPARSFVDGWLVEGDIKELVNVGTRVELLSLAKNQYLNELDLRNMIKRQGEFSGLSDEQYNNMLMLLGRNPRMSTKRDDTVYDGWAEHEYNEVFSAAWELTRELPATEDNAYILENLLRATILPIGFKNPEEVIERWRIDEKSDDEAHFTPYSHYLRQRLADLLEVDDKLLNSNDLAERESFYKRFSTWKYKDWPDFVERDGEDAFDAMVENEGLWHDAKTRRLLSNAAWKVPDPHSSMMAPNAYNAVEWRHRKHHAAWFEDENEIEEYGDDTDTVIRRLEEKSDDSASALEEFSESIQSSLKEDAESLRDLLDRSEEAVAENRDAIMRKVNDLQDKLDILNETNRLATQTYTGTPIWQWITIIILLIVILVK